MDRAAPGHPHPQQAGRPRRRHPAVAARRRPGGGRRLTRLVGGRAVRGPRGRAGARRPAGSWIRGGPQQPVRGARPLRGRRRSRSGRGAAARVDTDGSSSCRGRPRRPRLARRRNGCDRPGRGVVGCRRRRACGGPERVGVPALAGGVAGDRGHHVAPRPPAAAAGRTAAGTAAQPGVGQAWRRVGRDPDDADRHRRPGGDGRPRIEVVAGTGPVARDPRGRAVEVGARGAVGPSGGGVPGTMARPRRCPRWRA